MAQPYNPMLKMYALMSAGNDPVLALDEVEDDSSCVAKMRYLIQGKTSEQLKDMASAIFAYHGMSVEDMARQMGITVASQR